MSNEHHTSMPCYRSPRKLPRLKASIYFLGLMAFNTFAQASSGLAHMEFVTTDIHGEPLQHVVVSLHPLGEAGTKGPATTISIMDQRYLQFAPSVLALQTGTTVKFPNEDDVRHHVYSFSHPNAFELKLYHGENGATHTFEHTGVVVLGCNIHDGMVGYLRVVDSPYFSTSSQAGELSIENIPSGEYELQIWHPDIGMKLVRKSITVKPGKNHLEMKVAVEGSEISPAPRDAHHLQSLFRD